MIQEAVIVMTILGCGDQVQSCDLVFSPEKTWTTQAECNQAIPSFLLKVQNASYPVLTASCEAKASPMQTVEFQVANSEPLQDEVSDNETMFDKIRAKTDATDFVSFKKIRASLVSITDTPKILISKLKSVLGSN